MNEKTLVLYSSVDGQTLKIIERINELIGGTFELFDIDKHPDIDFSQYTKVLVGASIRYGNLRKNLLDYVNTHKVALNKLPNAFFLVCLTARKVEKSLPSNNTYMLKFEHLSAWKPHLKGVFAGALVYSRYNWWQTLLIQLIMKMTGGSTDKRQDIELTDWSKVEAFSKDFSAL